MGFQTPQYAVADLLAMVASGRMQLPDFQRDYKWDDDRIRQLLVSILRGHPIGVLMILETGNAQVRFRPKPITGVTEASEEPEWLLLDGQQRVTSLHQALTGLGVVSTEDHRHKKVTRRYFLDIAKAIGSPYDQDDAVVSLPADGIEYDNFGRDVVRDASSLDRQIACGLMPLATLFSGDPTTWMIRWSQAAGPAAGPARTAVFAEFQARVVAGVMSYKIPVICLDKATTKEAVATVFEKVNTGGLPLDTFELLTATFAGDPIYFREFGQDFRLGDDWARIAEVLRAHPVLERTERIDVLQAVTLLATQERRARDVRRGRANPSATSARREDVLRLDLADYLTWAPKVRQALPWVARFYATHHIHTAEFLPYRPQSVPLMVFRVLLGEQIDHHAVAERISRWYWCGVLGELYGTSAESRMARDVDQVPRWAFAALNGDAYPEPTTLREATFAQSRLLSLRTRQSAAYKGIYALLMSQGLKDWMLDHDIDHASYFEDRIDIHHIFPKAWCLRTGVDPNRRESIVNKTPLAKRTNIKIGGLAPSVYLPRVLTASGLSTERLEDLLRAHLVEPAALRADDFEKFFDLRMAALLDLIERAMGRPANRDMDGASGPTEGPEAFEDEPEDPEDRE